MILNDKDIYIGTFLFVLHVFCLCCVINFISVQCYKWRPPKYHFLHMILHYFTKSKNGNQTACKIFVVCGESKISNDDVRSGLKNLSTKILSSNMMPAVKDNHHL